MSRTGLPVFLDAKRERILARIRERGVLFIHVPKNAGTTLCEALYGMQTMHHSVRYYEAVAPDLLSLPSLAIVRDPFDRFLSAYRYAVDGGTADRRVAPQFRKRFMAFRSIDDALSYLADARSPYDLDHIFRPQRWYLTDREGEIAVDRFVDFSALDRIDEVAGMEGLGALPKKNVTGSASRGSTEQDILSPGQKSFLLAFYRDDFSLLEDVAQ